LILGVGNAVKIFIDGATSLNLDEVKEGWKDMREQILNPPSNIKLDQVAEQSGRMSKIDKKYKDIEAKRLALAEQPVDKENDKEREEEVKDQRVRMGIEDDYNGLKGGMPTHHVTHVAHGKKGAEADKDKKPEKEAAAHPPAHDDKRDKKGSSKKVLSGANDDYNGFTSKLKHETPPPGATIH